MNQILGKTKRDKNIIKRRKITILLLILLLSFIILKVIPNIALSFGTEKKLAKLDYEKGINAKNNNIISISLKYNLLDLITYVAIEDGEIVEITPESNVNYVIDEGTYNVNVKISNIDENSKYTIIYGKNQELVEEEISDEKNIQFAFQSEGKTNCYIAIKKDGEMLETSEWNNDVYYIESYKKQFLDETEKKGVGVHLIGTSPSKFIPIFKALGAKYIRADLRMNYIYKNGKFDFSAEYYNELIDEIDKTGAKILAILGSPGNILGNDGKVSNEQELKLFNDYVREVRDNYNNITDFEIWNEPNNVYMTDEEIEWYSKIVNSSSQILKENNKDIKVLASGIAYGTNSIKPEIFINKIAENGAYEFVNSFSYHIYDFLINSDLNKSYRDKLNEARSIHNELGGFVKTSNTEFGSSTYIGSVTEEQQALKEVQQAVIADQYDVEYSILYNFRNSGREITQEQHNFGITDSDYNPKPAYYALKTYYENTNGAEYIGEVNIVEGLEAHVYDKDGKPKIIVWSKNANRSIQMNYMGFIAKDMYGKDIVNTNGKIEITASPVYLDNISTNYFFQAISNTVLGEYVEFKEKFAQEIGKVEGLQEKINELKQYMQNISNVDSVTETVAKQRMEEHFNLGKLVLTAYKNESLDIEYVRLSSMLDMLNDIGNSYEDLVTVSAKTRNPDLENTKKLVDTAELELENNSDLEMIYPYKILEFSKDLYNKSVYINSLSEKNDIKIGLIVSKDLHAKYLAEWANIFIEIYIDEYIKNNPVSISYSETNLTNKDVVATLNGNNIKITNNEGKNTYTFTENKSFIFEYTIKGRNFKIEAKVNNIDKKAPEITNVKDRQILYTSIIPKITDENLDKITLKKDGQVITYKQGDKLQDKALYEIEVTDKAKNETKVIFRIADKPEYEYIVKEDKVLDIEAGTKASQIKKNFVTIEEYKIYREEQELKDNDTISTGDVAKLDNGNIYTLIVAGDINKDGKVTAYDLSTIRNYILRISQFDEIKMLAADANNDSKPVGASDYSKIREILLGIK